MLGSRVLKITNERIYIKKTKTKAIPFHLPVLKRGRKRETCSPFHIDRRPYSTASREMNVLFSRFFMICNQLPYYIIKYIRGIVFSIRFQHFYYLHSSVSELKRAREVLVAGHIIIFVCFLSNNIRGATRSGIRVNPTFQAESHVQSQVEKSTRTRGTALNATVWQFMFVKNHR